MPKNFRGLPSLTPPGHSGAYSTKRLPPALYNNFVIVFHEIEHSKTLFKNGNQ